MCFFLHMCSMVSTFPAQHTVHVRDTHNERERDGKREKKKKKKK